MVQGWPSWSKDKQGRRPSRVTRSVTAWEPKHGFDFTVNYRLRSPRCTNNKKVYPVEVVAGSGSWAVGLGGTTGTSGGGVSTESSG